MAELPALREDAEVRSNLAVVNGGSTAITLSVSLRGADGSPRGSTLTRTLAPGEWYQWSNVLGLAGVSDAEAYALITRTSGDAPWLAYGVRIDNRTSDSSVIGMVR